MNRLITSKPADSKKLNFAPMGSKPGIQKLAAKKTKAVRKVKKVSPFAKKAAALLTKE